MEYDAPSAVRTGRHGHIKSVPKRDSQRNKDIAI
jgi:hypothetical protein